ncbi:MAG: hypothetical protein ABSD47_01075 [Candidatus Methylomirabilota bacterium]|jgi:hypothetical protein
MTGYTVQKMETRGQALVAWVHYERADGVTKDERLGWPVEIKKAEIETVLEQRFKDFVAGPVSPPAVHEAMAMVGQAEDLSHLDPGAPAASAPAPAAPAAPAPATPAPATPAPAGPTAPAPAAAAETPVQS